MSTFSCSIRRTASLIANSGLALGVGVDRLDLVIVEIFERGGAPRGPPPSDAGVRTATP
jgi:hypothetical protein